jgi:hypothetical protein
MRQSNGRSGRLLSAGRAEWWARRSPRGRRKQGHPAELVGLSPCDVDAVQNRTGETRLFDLCVQGEALVEAFAIANGVERSDPLYQIWSEALARIRPPEAGVRPTSAGRPKLTGSGISPPNAPAIETTVQPLQMQGNPPTKCHRGGAGSWRAPWKKHPVGHAPDSPFGGKWIRTSGSARDKASVPRFRFGPPSLMSTDGSRR